MARRVYVCNIDMRSVDADLGGRDQDDVDDLYDEEPLPRIELIPDKSKPVKNSPTLRELADPLYEEPLPRFSLNFDADEETAHDQDFGPNDVDDPDEEPPLPRVELFPSQRR